MNFNFNETAGISQNKAKKALEGNAIYDVTFDGCEARDIQGVQDPSKSFKVLDIKFSNDDGYYTHTIWEPRDSDMEDVQGQYGKQPSNIKSMMLTLKHLIDAVNPELANAINEGKKSLNTTSWDALRQLMVKATDPGKGTKTKIKLLKKKNGDATFPGFVAAYNKSEQLYMRTNFIGNGIFFTKKELDQIQKQETAQPTPVGGVNAGALPFTGPAETTAAQAAPSDFDFNLDDLGKF